MKCGFCGADNPDNAKKCAKCGADMKSQRIPMAPALLGGINCRNKETKNDVPVGRLVIRIVVIPLIVIVGLFILLICYLSGMFGQGSGNAVNELNDEVVRKELQEYYGLKRSDYRIVKAGEEGADASSEVRNFRLIIGDREYELYDCGQNGQRNWRSDYYTTTFERKIRDYVRDLLSDTRILQGREFVVITKVSGLLPLWVNSEEINRITDWKGDIDKWHAAYKAGQTWTASVTVQLPENISGTEVNLGGIAKSLYFATVIEIECPDASYRYYPQD